MIQRILSYGVIAGVVASVPMSVIALGMQGDPPSHGMAIGYTIMLVALSTVFVAIKRHRDIELGGVIRFWPAFGMGLGISIVAGILYVATWEAASAFMRADFATSYADAMIAAQKAEGVHGEALARFVAEMERFKVNYANPLFRLPMTFMEIFPVGVLVSLVSAGLLRNPGFLRRRA